MSRVYEVKRSYSACMCALTHITLHTYNRYYALAATSALLKYVEFIQNIVYAPNSLRVIFKGSEQTAMIGQFQIMMQCICS